MKKTVLMMAAALSLVMASCGNKPAEQTSEKSKTAKETVKPKKKKKAPKQEVQVESSAIHDIESVWISNDIDVDSGDITPDIETFACAFCDAYPDYEPNQALYSYLVNPRGYDPEDNGFFIDNQRKYGYISVRQETELDWLTTCCYWNRNDGHKLFAVWMVEEHEDSSDEARLLLFYDYDPYTDTMTPEPKLTRKVERAMEDFDSYDVKLPAQGKDIELIGYVYDHDSSENSYYMLHWNGYDFEMAAG
ncbi:MAG: hypothetical protein IKX36_05690 [Prevotella sp.]|nr:hypothetical protein [Prevotella sp.]